MLQKIQIMLLLGLVVLFCAGGCEEDASLNAGGVRPVNNQPGKTAPLQTDDEKPKPVAKNNTPTVKTTTTPVAIQKPSVPPPTVAGKPKTEPRLADRDDELTPKQLPLFNTRKQDSLKLQMKLDELQEQNKKLTQALVDSRTTGQKLQGNLQRSMIVQEIQKRQLQELGERLGGIASGDPPTKTNVSKSNSSPVEPDHVKKNDPVNLMLRIGRMQRKIETLEWQLRLAKLDAPDARDQILVKLGESTEKNEALEKINRRLSHMVVTQADQVRRLEQREEELTNLQAEHADQIAQMDRKTRKELATMEIHLAENRKQIKTLKHQLARREYQIRTLKGQLASAKEEVKKQVALAGASKHKRETPPAPVARPVLVKVAPVTPAPNPTVAVAPAAKPNRTPLPVPRVKTSAPATAVSTSRAPTQTVPPMVPAPVHDHVAGTITAMKGLMVMIDVGKDTGVEEGMRLITYRDDKFVGYLRVEQVGRRESVCSFSRQILPPQLGDHVVDRLE